VAIKEFFMKDYCNRNDDTSHVTIGSEGSRDMVAEYRRKFLKEAQLIASMEDVPHIIRIYDIFEENETAYYVMAFVDGGSLKDLVKREGRLSEQQAVSYIGQVGEALAKLHERNILHLDIKPDNVLFDANGVAKLTDLGISRFSKEQDVRATQASAVIGTPAYMAPEQMLDSHSVDIRADVYSFGVMLHELLTGRRPNEGEGAMRTLAKAIEGRAFPDVRHSRPDTPAELAVLVSEMTLPDADQRPQSARLVLDLLTHPDRIPTGDDIPERVPWYKDRYVLYAATGMVIAFVALVLAIVKAARGV
jgi:serine/threonine protein kinase